MCSFFSCISNGKGKTLFFKVEEVCVEMVKGNPKNYEWNSHTSIAHFNGLSALEEDKYNKWEYNTDKKEITADRLVTTDDRDKVIESIEAYLKDKDIMFLRNLYNRNSGDKNSGDKNSGDRNSGDRNSGDKNSGDRNSGDRNSGDGNSGYRNSGDGNSGYRNNGDGNSGDGNSGDGNSGCIIGHFSSKKMFFLFNKPCTETEAAKVYGLNLWRYFNLNKWISKCTMSAKEKKDNPTYKITGGYLKTLSYKEAWANVPQEIIDKIKKLKNFDEKVFFSITKRVL